MIKNSDIRITVEDEEEEEKEEYSTSVDDIFKYEKYAYYFEFPSLTDSGYVEISNQTLTILFPEQPISYSQHKHYNSRSLQLQVNNQLVFCNQWIPTYTFDDCLRIKDMFYKAYKEIVAHEHTTANYQGCHYIPQDETTMSYSTKSFYLYCSETRHSTTICLDLKKNSEKLNLQKPCPVNCLNIVIGNNLVFCSKTLLESIAHNDVQFIISFILYKLI